MSAAPNVSVDVQLACDDADIPAAANIQDWIARTLTAVSDKVEFETEVSVRVVGADEMRTLNKDYRHKDKPTNVLSFPAGELAGLPEEAGRPLGDIIICASVVRDEAQAQKKALADHWGHLLVHGMLHLLGFDHIKDSEAINMERLETSILADAGVADPYRVQ